VAYKGNTLEPGLAFVQSAQQLGWGKAIVAPEAFLKNVLGNGASIVLGTG
jgi:hypothetical protein